MPRLKLLIANALGFPDQSAEIENLKQQLDRKQSMIERQLRLCVALTKLEVLVRRKGDLKIQQKKKGSQRSILVASSTDGAVSLQGATLEDALLGGSSR